MFTTQTELSPVTFSILSRFFCISNQLYFKATDKVVILRACDFFAFARKGLLSMEGVPVAPTNAFSLGNNPLPFSHPLLSVIPSVPGFPTSPPSPTTTDVVLLKENHMQLTEAATSDRKSGAAEGPAVRHSGAPHFSFYNHFPSSSREPVIFSIFPCFC